LTAAGLDFVTKHDFFPVVVHPRIKHEAASLSRIRDSPPREGARNFLHVLLGVPAVDAERVELHQFTGIVFVQAARISVLRRRRKVGDRSLTRERSDLSRPSNWATWVPRIDPAAIVRSR